MKDKDDELATLEKLTKINKQKKDKGNNSYNQTSTLNQFGVDLTKQAEEGKKSRIFRGKNQP